MENRELKDKIQEQQSLIKEQLEKVAGGHHKITIETVRRPDGLAQLILSCLLCGSGNVTTTDDGILCNDCGFLLEMKKLDPSEMPKVTEIYKVIEENPVKE